MPSPNVIVSPGLERNLAKERADMFSARAIGAGITGTADIISGAILQYSQMKDKEDIQNMALLRDIIGTYGDSAGQPALQEYDKLLQKRGIGGLPKDPVTGDILSPPKTTEQLVDKQIQNDPQSIQDLAFKKTQGMGRMQVALKAHEAELVAAKQTALERHQRAMEAAAMLRAQRTGLKSFAVNQPSPYIMDQKTSEVQTLAPDQPPPPGFTRLAGGQIDKIFKQQELGNKTELNDANLKLKKADLEAKMTKAGNALAYGTGKGFLNYAIAKHDGKIDSKFDKVMKPAFDQFLRDQGLDPVVDEKPWWDSFGKFLSGIGPSGVEQLKKESDASALPGEPKANDGPVVIKLKDGTVIHKVP